MSPYIVENKTVLVTGAARRIGREIALAFARKGARVLAHFDRSRREAESLAREIREMGSEVALCRADLSRPKEAAALARKILKTEGAVDVLVNSASVFYPAPWKTLTERDWNVFLALHVKAPFFLAQSLAPAMKKRGAGRIINIADAGVSRGASRHLAYMVSKAALLSLTQGLAKALAPEVLVTAVCPGPVLAPEDYSRSDRRKDAAKTLVGRWGRPEDVAQAVLYLVESEYVTGSAHMVDGGMHLV
jgi:NAD(P)-dependent dehydrogenase (short-subunit alcohol dehydrogenase family)